MAAEIPIHFCEHFRHHTLKPLRPSQVKQFEVKHGFFPLVSDLPLDTGQLCGS